MKLRSLFATILAVVFSTGMLFAQDAPAKKISPYAQIRYQIGVHSTSKELNAKTTGERDTDLMNDLLATTRVGANFKNGKFKGKVELGLKGANAGNAVYMRQAWFSYDMGFANILMGQTYTPYAFFSSDKAYDDGFNGFGSTYDGRLPQIKVSAMGASLTLVTPSTKNMIKSKDAVDADYSDDANLIFAVDAVKSTSASSIDAIMPKIVLSYEYKNSMFSVGPGFAINAVKFDSDKAASAAKALDGETLVSWLAYVHGTVNVADFYAKINASYAQNGGDFGLCASKTAATYATINADGDAFENTYSMEGYIELGYKVMGATVAAGVGYLRADNDLYEAADAQLAYFGEVIIPVTKNFTVTPVVHYYDFLKDASDTKEQGNDLFAGVKVQVNL